MEGDSNLFHSKSPPYATYMEGLCKILFRFMTFVNCYAMKLFIMQLSIQLW